MRPAELRVVIAFAEPPAHWGFRISRAGTSWYIRLAAERVSNCLKALRDLNIRCAAPPPKPAAKHAKGRGKQARAQKRRKHDTLSQKQAFAIFEAGVIEGRKRARNAADTKKRSAEMRRQNEQRIRAEQIRRAEAVVAKANGITAGNA